MMSEHEMILLRRFTQTGDTEAFSEITRLYAGMVHGTCLRVTGDAESARDATQDTFFQLLKQAGKVTGSLGGWLHQVATRRAVDLVRRDSARRQREQAFAAEAVLETDVWADISPLVDEALNEIEPDQRELLLRHFLQGQSTVQMAAAEGVSQPTMSRRVEGALEKLRERLRKKGVGVAAAALGVMMAGTAQEAPAAVLAELGKMSLASSGLATATALSFKAKLAIALAVAVVGTGGFVAYKATRPAAFATAAVTMKNKLLLISLSTLLAASGGAATNPISTIPAAELPGKIASATASSDSRSLALNLLQKHAETLAKLRSFICVEEGSTEKQARFTEQRSASLNGNTRNLRRTEFRMDGNRYSIDFRRWGNVRSATEFVPEARGSRNSYLWDGKTYFANYIDTRLNEEEARQKKWLPELWWELSRRDGFPDVDLAEASSLSVRTKMESVGGAKCYVIEAVTPVSDDSVTPAVHSTVYDTLWIDPERGYTFVQATRLNKYERGSNSGSLERVVCKEIEGVWMPVDGDRRRSYSFANGDYDRNVTHLKITKIILNPDHKALRSFVPDLKNGTPVILNPRVGMSVPPPRLQPVWQDGRVVDRQGHILFDSGLTNTNSGTTIPAVNK